MSSATHGLSPLRSLYNLVRGLACPVRAHPTLKTPAMAVPQAGMAIGWVAYLLASPTRSSLTGVARSGADVEAAAALHNGLLDTPGPADTELLRPWKLAEVVSCGSEAQARVVARHVNLRSGFRSRLAALRQCAQQLPQEDGSLEEPKLRESLDCLTYVRVEFANPDDPSHAVSAVALVDTGATDCDLRQELIDKLNLRRGKAGKAVFQTAAGRTMNSALHTVLVRVQGHEATTQVCPIEADEEEEEDGDDLDRLFGFSSQSDDAVLGRKALAALDLLVDCRSRSLVEAAASKASARSVKLKGGTHVIAKFAHPSKPGRTLTAKALIDTGSTDIDLQSRTIKALELPIDADEGVAQFETAGGVEIQAPIHRGMVSIADCSAVVRISPSEEDGSDEDDDSDEALLGHDALASLGLLVDCRRQQLLTSNGP
mmetsp:Transcript_56215/g.126468  ORF Transcript_56215/g.126468 Transcript_56215/m.126468 type:complete len:429 (-) Transcript_56215:19-1305(-)